MNNVVAAARNEVVIAGAAVEDVVASPSEDIPADIGERDLICEMGAVNRFVATSGPASAALHEKLMRQAADGDVRRPDIEMALEAEIRAALGQQLVVHRAVGVVAGGATFAHRFVLEDEGAALRRVAFRAAFVEPEAGRRRAEDAWPLVRVVAIAAGDVAFRQRMVMREIESSAQFNVAAETDVRRPPGIDDVLNFAGRENAVKGAAGLRVDAAGPVAGFAAHLDRFLAGCRQRRVNGEVEIAGDRLVAFRATLRARELRAGNLRGRERHPADGVARNDGGRCDHRSREPADAQQPPAA